MTDERAMEILDPEHREHYESIEPVNEACRIGMEAIRKVKELKAENAALRERLKKVLELPVPLGTPVLKVWRNRVPTDDTRMDFVDMWEITTVSFKLEYYTLWGKQYFHNTEEGRKAALARFAELQGEQHG